MFAKSSLFLLCLMSIGLAACGIQPLESSFGDEAMIAETQLSVLPSETPSIRTEIPAVPSYPQVVQEPEIMVEEWSQGPNFPAHIVKFQTLDPPDVVRAFYKEQLLADGWVNPSESDDTIMLGNLAGCPYYYMGVRTFKYKQKPTEVEVILYPLPCGPHPRF